MFGKPRWFRPRVLGWGLTPITWQGWGYTAIWAGVLLGPYLWLVCRGEIWIASIVEATLIAVLVFDTWQILRAIKMEDRGE